MAIGGSSLWRFRSRVWEWATVSANPGLFSDWIDLNQNNLKGHGNFGNHRKYESLKRDKTGVTIESYVAWVGPAADHAQKFITLEPNNDDPRERFQSFYYSLNDIYRFGRTAKFDYITMLGKLGLANLEPDSVYMHGASGPYTGANLLFTGNGNSGMQRNDVEDQLAALDAHLQLRFGMQILEDALCNWQKDPASYQYFSG